MLCQVWITAELKLDCSVLSKLGLNQLKGEEGVEEEVGVMAGRTGLLDQLCSEWADDQRMSVLFAPLRAKEVNPESWNSKVNFWSNLVIK